MSRIVALFVFLKDGVSAFPRVLFSPLSPIVSLLFFPWLDGVSAFPRVLPPFVSHCTPSCSPSCFPLSPIASLLPFVGWCVRLFGVLSPLVSDIAPLLLSLCWMACPPSQGSCFLCLPLYPLSFLIVGPCGATVLGFGLVWGRSGTYVGPMVVHVRLLGAMLGPS